MATFVLVSGAWSGGWIWRDVAARLRFAGHGAHAPTLTGLGERVHLARCGVDLETHVADLTNVLRFKDLSGVVLVGWSQGGMAITGAADRASQRVARLVYLDAPVPADGQSYYDTDADGASRLATDRAEAEAAGDPVFRPVPEPYIRERVADPAALAWVLGNSVPHPIATLTQPLRLRDPRIVAGIPRAYVYCTEGKDPGGQSALAAAAARADPAWDYREIADYHLAPVTSPAAVADALLSLA